MSEPFDSRGPLRFPVLARALLAFLPALAGCQSLDSPVHIDDGLYAGVLAGGMIEQFDLPAGVESETGGIVGARVGLRLLDRRIALEASYEELGPVDIRLKSPRLEFGEFSGRTFMGQLKGYTNAAPIQGYGLIGLGVLDGDIEDSLGIGLASSQTEFTFKLGGGLEVHSGAHWTFFVESAWTRSAETLDEFEFITVLGGVNYRF